MRITALLQKIHELAGQAENATVIDVDLMLDYTRVLYSDLLEWRREVINTEIAIPQPGAASANPAANGSMNGTHTYAASPAAVIPDPTPVMAAPVATPAETILETPPGALLAEETDTADETAAEPELTLEEYLARQGKDDDETDEPVAPAPVARPDLQHVQIKTAVQAETAPPPARTEPQVPARDIRSMIGINDKYQIMSELFGNDKAAYEQALDFINRAESEQAAFNWLRERLWVTEDHSDAAMIFFDVVRRFKNP